MARASHPASSSAPRLRSRPTFARPLALLAAAVAIAVIAGPLATPARAWWGDFFDGSASGQATYEQMAIHSEAVYYEGVTYAVYQGALLDPYIVGYDHARKAWIGPVKIGTNPLGLGWDPDDSHGAPALHLDKATGHLHVYWGAHRRPLEHARTRRPRDITSWVRYPQIGTDVTYPQVFHDADGLTHLFVRMDENSDGKPDATSATKDRGGWARAVSTDGGETFSQLRPVLKGGPDWSWYVHFEAAADGSIHCVLTALERAANTPYARKGVFYARFGKDGLWRSVTGSPLTSSPFQPLDRTMLLDNAASTMVVNLPTEFQNEVEAADDGEGRPGLVFVTGKGDGPDAYRFLFARHDGTKWVTTKIASTDHFMDAAAISWTSTSSVEAFLVRRGTRGTSDATDRYRDRGGDIERWVSADCGTTWTMADKIISSDVDRGLVYNDPQLVEDATADARLVFTEWDNDAGNTIHKVFLWGDAGYKQREFFPQMERLGGRSRWDVPVSVSKSSFARGSDTVILASGTAYADALSAVPLAQAYRAPILLTPAAKLPDTVAAEISRLKARRVLIVGGTASVGPEVASYLQGRKLSVARISGKDRYEVSRRIAAELQRVAGKPGKAVIVGGNSYGDALAASPLAAVRGYPILLTESHSVSSQTRDTLRSLGVTSTLVVGGERSVSATAMRSLPKAARIGGADRYETAAAVARLGLEGGEGVPASLSMTRFVVAPGETFDALVGGVLAARVRGPIILTATAPGDGEVLMSQPAEELLGDKAYRVLEAYVMGGERSFPPELAARLAGILYERQND